MAELGRYMTRMALLVILACAGCDGSARTDQTQRAVAKREAQAIAVAILEGEYSEVVDRMYDKSVERMGGRESAIELVSQGMEVIASFGGRLTSLRIGEAGDVFRDGEMAFVVIPTELTIAMSDKTLAVDSYLLGISADRGVSWKFIDGEGLKDRSDRDAMLPRLPDGLKLPEWKLPRTVSASSPPAPEAPRARTNP